MESRKPGVVFWTSDDVLLQTVLHAEDKLRGNLKDFAGFKVLIEGGGYNKIWLETQPMGGEMYAKRDIEAAKNNQLLFIRTQREDGRLPGSITVEDGKLLPQFNKFQGFCFAGPALNMYYWLDEDRAYLDSLRKALEGFDRYLWENRDSNQDGILESWCVTDTGEDGALRYKDAPFWWEEETPPTGYQAVPIASMDFMGYSCAARQTLADISLITKDGKAAFWQKEADKVRDVIRDKLWDDSRGACFDIDCNGQKMAALLHDNLRLMYWKALYPDMTERFVKEHLLNPEEFWTPFPLPSVSRKDPLYRNAPGNDWSGQPQGLTWQRAITALENYGYDALVPVLAEKLFAVLKRDQAFTQQFDPDTGKPTGRIDGYGPTMLAFLEYLSRVHGVHPQRDEIRWTATGARQTDYTVRYREKEYRLVCDGKTARALIDQKVVFEFAIGKAIITDREGGFVREIDLVYKETTAC